MNDTQESRGDREHREILAAMNTIEAVFERWTTGTPPPEEVDELGGAIFSLRARLRRHFRYEEQKGLLAVRDGLDPEDRRLVEELLREHRTLEEQLSKRVDEVGGSGGLLDRFPPILVREMRSLFRDVRRHEAHEEMLQRKLDRRKSGEPGA